MATTVTTASTAETEALGQQVGQLLEGGENLLLRGDLGSGKTAFARGVAQGLGIREAVKSPTFTYLQEYPVPMRSTRFAHFDLYRLPEQPSPLDLERIELPERFNDPDTITLIEWADRLDDWMEGQRYEIEFVITNGDQRQIELPKKLAYPAKS